MALDINGWKSKIEDALSNTEGTTKSSKPPDTGTICPPEQGPKCQLRETFKTKIEQFENILGKGEFSCSLFKTIWPHAFHANYGFCDFSTIVRLFVPIEHMIRNHYLNKKTFEKIANCLNSNKELKHLEEFYNYMESITKASENMKLTDDEYVALAKLLTNKFIKINEISKDNNNFLKYYRYLAQLLINFRNSEDYQSLSKYDRNEIIKSIENVETTITRSKIGYTLEYFGGVLHHQIRKSVINIDTNSLIFGCGIENPDEIINSSLSDGKRQWDSYALEDTFSKVKEFINGNNKLNDETSLTCFLNLITGIAIMAGSFYLVNAISKFNCYENTIEKKNLLVLTSTSLGFHLIWFGININNASETKR
jgi:hypothetical protein